MKLSKFAWKRGVIKNLHELIKNYNFTRQSFWSAFLIFWDTSEPLAKTTRIIIVLLFSNRSAGWFNSAIMLTCLSETWSELSIYTNKMECHFTLRSLYLRLHGVMLFIIYFVLKKDYRLINQWHIEIILKIANNKPPHVV